MIVNLYDRVKKILQSYPQTRDSDNKLVAIIWGEDTIKETRNILVLLADEQLASFESIGRARRKVQELCPTLRGSRYHARQELQVEVKKDLREIEVVEKVKEKVKTSLFD